MGDLTNVVPRWPVCLHVYLVDVVHVGDRQPACATLYGSRLDLWLFPHKQCAIPSMAASRLAEQMAFWFTSHDDAGVPKQVVNAFTERQPLAHPEGSSRAALLEVQLLLGRSMSPVPQYLDSSSLRVSHLVCRLYSGYVVHGDNRPRENGERVAHLSAPWLAHDDSACTFQVIGGL